ncbi:MAG TPA: efflux RND transporter periplasmic adaptor subunit [Candidatus Paceibacterota bacterium]|nr:efflux RND transporter periplasmic adaptor subunit [Verrucomicrobiota bacterium]HRZ47135.1 efflux RND transporter periplasmic adaptor subunit [Candidatus Paceibacterota bacterium]HRZ54394.1 efflux RND transporter periplasmic adaptor subunit [Candidatus Paceibacterota bacterium]
MNMLRYSAVVAVLVAGAFLLGAYRGQQRTVNPGDGRRILHYVDPMNPAHTSDKPGLAPCGMKMEPVYADELDGSSSVAGQPQMPGTVKVSPHKQQLIGVRVAPVERRSLEHTLRLLGRVALDETRSYRVTAAVDGWITKALPFTAGSRVKQNELLATCYGPELFTTAQSLLYALTSKDRGRAADYVTVLPGATNRIFSYDLAVQLYIETLRGLGMGQKQIDDLLRTRTVSRNLDITAPADGFVVERNISEGQRFTRGTDLFRIADLSRVWILADVFENEAQLVKPGLDVRVCLPHQNRVFPGRISENLPQFDPVSRTLKLRVELANPDFVLQPEMFVDLELPVRLSDAIVIPADAIVQSGLQRQVFVERAAGIFEPRPLVTGLQLGDQVEVREGLTAGDRLVISGNFLLDSESRMRLAAAGMQTTPAIDPVCGMTVDEQNARAAGRVSDHAGKAYFFCADSCRQKFEANPGKFIEARAAPVLAGAPAAAGPKSAAIDPVCGMTVDEHEARAAGRVLVHAGKVYFFCADSCKRRFEANPRPRLGGAVEHPGDM